MRVCTLLCALPVVLSLNILPGALHATTFERRSLERLAAEHDLIVYGQVVEMHCRWNAARDFILTEVRLRTMSVLHGPLQHEWRFTLLGGTVDGITVLVPGEARLTRGNEYVIFLHPGNLPGEPGRLTVRERAQGVFDVERGRAVSQSARFRLAADADGRSDPAGGSSGLSIESLTRIVRAHAGP
jgi:hypothetical protein